MSIRLTASFSEQILIAPSPELTETAVYPNLIRDCINFDEIKASSSTSKIVLSLFKFFSEKQILNIKEGNNQYYPFGKNVVNYLSHFIKKKHFFNILEGYFYIYLPSPLSTFSEIVQEGVRYLLKRFIELFVHCIIMIKHSIPEEAVYHGYHLFQVFSGEMLRVRQFFHNFRIKFSGFPEILP